MRRYARAPEHQSLEIQKSTTPRTACPYSNAHLSRTHFRQLVAVVCTAPSPFPSRVWLIHTCSVIVIRHHAGRTGHRQRCRWVLGVLVASLVAPRVRAVGRVVERVRQRRCLCRASISKWIHRRGRCSGAVEEAEGSPPNAER